MDRGYILKQLNDQICSTIEQLNSIIDFGISVEDEVRLESSYQVILDEHICAVDEYKKKLTYYRDAYNALSVKIKERAQSESKQMRRLYTRLQRTYTVKALLNDIPASPIPLWDIPFAFDIPQSTLPVYNHPKLRNPHGFVNNCRKSMKHFHFRAHWSTSKAEVHLKQLREELQLYERKSIEFQNTSTKAKANIESAQREIEAQRMLLTDSPPHHIWRDAYVYYAEMVRQWFMDFQDECFTERHSKPSIMKLPEITAPIKSTDTEWIPRTAASYSKYSKEESLEDRLSRLDLEKVIKPAKSMNFAPRSYEDFDADTTNLEINMYKPCLSVTALSQLRESVDDSESSSIYENEEVLTPITPIDDDDGYTKQYSNSFSNGLESTYC